MSEEILINGKKITELSDMFFEYCKLKKENEDLKTYIQKMDKPEIKTIDSEIALKNIELQKENDELKEKNKSIAKDYVGVFGDYQKYKQALKEIKSWATNHNPCDIEADINCTKEDCFKCLNYDLKKITNKINEVLNDRD